MEELRPGSGSSGVAVPPARALIADDQPEVLEALRLLLKGEGIQPYAVSSPAAVLEAVKSRDFDIVVMDLNYARDTTSGREGLDLLDEINGLNKGIPIIVMTGWGSVDLAVEAMRRGICDFVQKPWDNEKLLRTVLTHISQGQTLRKGQRLREDLKRITDAISAAGDLHTLVNEMSRLLKEALRITSVAVFTRAPLDQSFWAAAHAGSVDEIVGRMKFEPDSTILRYMNGIFDPCARELPEKERRNYPADA